MQQIHIGNLIREELRRSGHTNQWLADRIGITPRTLQKLYNKPSIDTQQLLTISRALGIDLFRHYSDALTDIGREHFCECNQKKTITI